MLPKDLAPASFRGVRFLVPKDSAEEGRNAVEHNYPDASFRYLEDNGAIPPIFTISAVLHGSGLPGKLNSLRSALNKPGPGTLKHPYYGSQFVQVMGPYRVEREDADSGVIKLEIKFGVTGPPVLPGLVSGIAAVVSGLASSAITAVFREFASVYGGGGSSPGSRTAIGSLVSGLGSSLVNAFGGAAAGRLVAESYALTDNPQRLGRLLESAVTAPLADTTLSPDTLRSGFRDLLAQGAALSATAPAIGNTTEDYAIRQTAVAALGQAVEVAAFAGLCDAAAASSYATADEVQSVEDEIVAAYGVLQERALSADTHAQVRDLFIAASDILRDEAVRLPRVAELDVVLTPASVLAYQLYGSDTNHDRIMGLNPGRNPLLYHGPVNVLST